MIRAVLAIDPGLAKCGLAIVSRDEGVIVRTVVAVADIPDTAKLLVSRFRPDAVIMGNGTGARALADIFAYLDLPVHLVGEKLSTQRARVRYFKDNPPKGWRRLIPRGLLVPPEPYDDYAAILLAEEFLANHQIRKE